MCSILWWEIIFHDMSLEGMVFELNILDYQWVGSLTGSAWEALLVEENQHKNQ